jgi:hypothetical protein
MATSADPKKSQTGKVVILGENPARADEKQSWALAYQPK